MLQIIIDNCQISLVPQRYRKEKKIRDYITKFGRPPLLDASEHQHLVKNIPADKRKDRPDILHFGLLLALNYAKVFEWETEILFTIGKNIYTVLPETRLPRNQRRFYSIMEQILLGQYKAKFIKKINDHLHHRLHENVFLFSKQGSINFRKVKINPDEADYSLVFGGMSKGSLDPLKFPRGHQVNLGKKPLELWTAISMALSSIF